VSKLVTPDSNGQGKLSVHRRTNTIAEKPESFRERDNSSKSTRTGLGDKGSKVGSLAIDLNKLRNRDSSGPTSTKGRPATSTNSDRNRLDNSTRRRPNGLTNGQSNESLTERISRGGQTETAFNLPLNKMHHNKSPNIARPTIESGQFVGKDAKKKEMKISTKSFGEEPKPTFSKSSSKESARITINDENREAGKSPSIERKTEQPEKRVLTNLESSRPLTRPQRIRHRATIEA